MISVINCQVWNVYSKRMWLSKFCHQKQWRIIFLFPLEWSLKIKIEIYIFSSNLEIGMH